MNYDFRLPPGGPKPGLYAKWFCEARYASEDTVQRTESNLTCSVVEHIYFIRDGARSWVISVSKMSTRKLMYLRVFCNELVKQNVS